jgi:SAM-dependent methyltransferase
VVCQHGLQFFADRVAALGEMNRVLRPGGRAAICVWRSIEHHPRGQLIWEALAHRFATSVSVLLPFFNLGDASELEALLEAAGFTDVTITARSYNVREPRSAQIIAPILASVGGCVPVVRIMGPDERAAMAHAIECDIGRALQTYVEGDEQVYQTAAHIAMGRK